MLDRPQLYTKLALKMTEWEMHRTQSQFEAQLIYKNFLFQFFDYYSAIIYIAFFKGKFVGYPGHYSTFLGLRNESVRTLTSLSALVLNVHVHRSYCTAGNKNDCLVML